MMKMRSVAASLAIVFALTACGGGGGRSAVGSLPGGSAPVGKSTGGNVQFKLTIPASNTTSSNGRRSAQTVSSQTQSITVTVNGGTPQIFNVSSSNCSGTPLTCTLTVGAPYGLDSFLVITYSGQNGTGTALNAAVLTFSVTSGGDNSASAVAGNLLIVNSSADGSGGSYSCASGSTTCTLREAVAEASTATGVFTALLFQGVTSITVGSQITIGEDGAQNIVLIGPGATAANTSGVGAPSASSQLTISGGGSSGIFYVDSGSLTVDGLTLANGNNSDGYGGAIENYGTLAISNTIFSNNTAMWEGGAVYDENTGSPESEIVASTFTGNTSEEGGAYFDEDGALFEASLFTNNSAYYSGDQYGEAGALYADWDLSVDGSVFTNNVAGSTSGANVSNGGYGGAISIDTDDGGTQTITNSTFGGSSSLANIAGGTGAGDCGEGGAVDYWNGAENTLTTAGNTFNGNKAMGGAIGDCEYEVPYGAIGGGLGIEYGALDSGDIGGPDTFTNNVADGSAGTGESGGGGGGGAAMLLDNATWNGVTFSGNTAKGGSGTETDGGAVIADGVVVTMTGATFTNNTSTAPSGTYTTGGGMAAFGAVLTLSSTTFSGNTASAGSLAFGGGLSTDATSHAFTSVTFTSNTATGTTVALGGGMLGYDSDTGGDGCQESCGKHKRTAPASLAKYATFAAGLKPGVSQRHNSHHVALAKRHANSRHTAHHVASLKAPKSLRRVPTVVSTGGGGSSSSFSGVTFTSNTANGGTSGGDAFGGGAELSGTPIITGLTANGNTVTVSGSGSYGAGGGISYSTTSCDEITITGSNIYSNSAPNAGGGLWNVCEAVVTQSTISGNIVTAPAYAEDGGGGIYNDGDLELVQSSVATNRVTASFAGSGGGGIMNDDAGLFVLDSTIFSNSSATDGGGLENADYGYALFLNATVAANTASGKGGSIDNESSGEPDEDEVDIQNSIFAGGSAPTGPEVANLDTFYSYGGNLIQGTVSGNAIPAASSPPNDLLGVNPQLAASFTNNGGPTSTIAETASSPTIGAIPFANGYCGNGGPNLDQRNYSRGANGVCDIGAYEFNGTPSTATLTLPASTVAPRMPQALRSLFAR